MAKKAKQRFSWTYNHDRGQATVTDTIEDVTVTYDLTQLPDVIRERIEVYGLGKVLQDRNSGTPAANKITGMTETFKSLESGSWKAERTFGARLLPPVIEVIGKRKKCSVAAAQAAYRALDDAEKVALKEALVEEIQAVLEARATAEEIDLTDLIS